MDREITYPGQLPLTEQYLQTQVDAMVCIGALAEMTCGGSTWCSGLVCVPGTGLTVSIGPGTIMATEQIDPNAFGVLGTNFANTIKLGINEAATVLTVSAPGTAGQSINFLVEGALGESDTTSLILPYYNAANPALPYNGQNNLGVPQNTRRLQVVGLGIKAGTAAATGSQTTPSVDAGDVPLYVITVPYGATSITTGMIAVAPGAPFMPIKLPQCTVQNAVHGQTASYSGGAYSWTPPAGVYSVACQIWGAGGGGGGGASGNDAAGGGGGGERIDFTLAVTPGVAVTGTVGAGGSGATPGSAGGTGGSTVFGGRSAIGGTGGNGAASGALGTGGAAGSGGTYLSGDEVLGGGIGFAGQYMSPIYIGGFGAATIGGGGVAPGGFAQGSSGAVPGGGGAGGANGGGGGAGAPGGISLRW